MSAIASKLNLTTQELTATRARLDELDNNNSGD